MPPSGTIPEIRRLISDLVFGSANGHGPLERIVENQHADLIDGAQILHHADRGQPRQLDLLAFHRRGLVDDQHHGGAFGRSRRSELGGQGPVQRILHLLGVVIDVALAGDHQQAPALLDELLDLVFSCGG